MPSQISHIMPGMSIQIAGSAKDDDHILKRLGGGVRAAENAILGKGILRSSMFDRVPMAAVLVTTMGIAARVPSEVKVLFEINMTWK